MTHILLAAILVSFVPYVCKARTLALLIGVPTACLVLLRVFVSLMVG